MGKMILVEAVAASDSAVTRNLFFRSLQRRGDEKTKNLHLLSPMQPLWQHRAPRVEGYKLMLTQLHFAHLVVVPSWNPCTNAGLRVATCVDTVALRTLRRRTQRSDKPHFVSLVGVSSTIRVSKSIILYHWLAHLAPNGCQKVSFCITG